MTDPRTALVAAGDDAVIDTEGPATVHRVPTTR